MAIKIDLKKIDLGKLIGVKDLHPEETGLYEEVISGGNEAPPSRIKMFYPDKDKATLKIKKLDRKKKSAKDKSKRKTKKKDCGCK
jgi:hypothetical protein